MSTIIESRHREIALFSTLVALLLAVGLRVLRTGIETDEALLWKVAALTVFVLNAPFVLQRIERLSSPAFTGIKMLFALALGLAIASIGTIGIAILGLAAIASLAPNIVTVARRQPLSFRVAALIGLSVVAAIAVVADFAATKYTNAFSDQLVLYGRADGDVLIHSALINAWHYFAEPSAGIDGIALAKYHFGMHAIVALLAESSVVGAVLAFSVFKAVLLYALAFGAALQCATLLRPAAGRQPSLLLLLIALAVVALIPPFDMGYLASANSETAMFSGFIIFALLPFFHPTLTDPASGRAAQVRALLIAACLVVPLSLFKLSAGYTWATAIFVWSLMAFGLRDRVIWIAWAITAVGGLLSVHLFTLTGQAEPFGTPYFVEYGFAKGDYLLPVAINIGSLLFLALSAGRRWRGADSEPLSAKRDFRFIAVTLVLANVPGLLLDIESGNAGHFIVQQNLLALPFLTAALVALIQDGLAAGRTRGALRAAGIAVATAIVLPGLYGAGKKWTADTRAVIAQRALITTADGSYYRSTRKRDLKADANRYLEASGFGGLLSKVTATPPAAGLASALMDARSEYGNSLAVYVSPDVGSFWDLTYDCDGKSLFTMTAAGLPMINGFPPCPPKFVDNGYPPIIGATALDPIAICTRALGLGIPYVFVIMSLDDRSEDEILKCEAGNT